VVDDAGHLRAASYAVDYVRGNGIGEPLRYRCAMANIRPVGDHLREWRQRRRMSQLDLAVDAEISTRHLSFLETGRSQPSRDMVLRLAQRLDVPLRERNMLLVSAGFAPVFPERTMSDPALGAARRAVDLVLKGHEPYPAIAVDRHWTLIAHNRLVPLLMAIADEELRKPPINVLRLSLHPKGLAPHIANLAEWREHLLARLRRQVDVTADPVMVDLLKELSGYPKPRSPQPVSRNIEHDAAVAVPLRLVTPNGVLSFISTITVFGTPIDITLSELALETFFPADAATGEALRQMAKNARG
jgi:transcriptional regulator with XRE-family HTH domain